MLDPQARLESRLKELRVAGALLFVSAVQFSLAVIVAEAFYPGYSISANHVSDLGIGATGTLFAIATALFGAMLIIVAYFMQKSIGSRLFSILITLVGIGAFLVGIFNENDFALVHGISASIAFVASALAAIYAFKFQRAPMNYFSLILGILSLAAIVISTSFPLAFGLGVGGIERLIIYPTLLWSMGFGGYLLGVGSENKKLKRM